MEAPLLMILFVLIIFIYYFEVILIHIGPSGMDFDNCRLSKVYPLVHTKDQERNQKHQCAPPEAMGFITVFK